MILLDTHVLVWLDTDDRRLGPKTRALIDKHWSSGEVAVSAVSFWEVGRLSGRGRIALASSPQDWRARWIEAGLTELALEGAVATRSLDLDGLSDDPADRFIAATALIHGASLVTADQRILNWRHTLSRQDACS
jgi:PIN domain nuclease of toxin-antitoxin system